MSLNGQSGGNGISIPFHEKPPGRPAFYDIWKLLTYTKEQIPYGAGVSFEPTEIEGQPVLFIHCLWRIGNQGHYYSKPIMCGPRAGLTREGQESAVRIFTSEVTQRIAQTCLNAGVADVDPIESIEIRDAQPAAV